MAVSASEIAVFDTEADAERAYFGQGAGASGNIGGDGMASGSEWTDPTTADELEGGWLLLRQTQAMTSGGATRWFVAGGPDGFDFIRSDGRTITPEGDETFDDMPSFESEEDAREAHAKWLGDNGGEHRDLAWSDWSEIEEATPWFVFAREREDGGAIEAVIAGQDSDGSTVYLAPGVEIVDDAHLYFDLADVDAALEAYFAAVDQGQVAQDDRPSGEPPSIEDIEQDTPEPGSQGNRGFVSAIVGNPVMLIGLLVVAYLVYRRYQTGEFL